MSPAPVCDTSQSERKRIGIKRQSGNAKERRKGGSPRPATVGKTDGERGGNRRRLCTRTPQRAPAPVASQRHTSYRNTATPGTDGSHERTLRPPHQHRQATARTHRSEPSLPAKRSAPGHANHQRPNAKRQGTHGRSDQTEDAKAEHERTTEATGEAHRRTPGHAPKGGHPARQNQKRRRQTHRLRDRQRTKDRHRHRSRKARPAPEQTTRRAQETQGNQGSRTHRRRRQAKPTPPGPTGTKNTATAEKTHKQGQNRW